MPEPCKHYNFAMIGKVGRMVRDGDDLETGAPIAFHVDITVTCRDCGLPFEWVGFPAGFSFLEPMVSVDNLELRTPLKPQGVTMPALEGAIGFSVKRSQ